MDEQDANEWGGPTQVRSEYYAHGEDKDASISRTGVAAANKSSITPLDDWDDLPWNQSKSSTVQQGTVGARLLRVWGWRESLFNPSSGNSTAFVPMDEDEHEDITEERRDQDERSVLTSKRLRKIQLSLQMTRLPPAKHDTYGLGHVPFENAPEFQAYHQQRRRKAEERARAATGRGRSRKTIYSTADLGLVGKRSSSGGVSVGDDDSEEWQEDGYDLARRRGNLMGGRRLKNNIDATAHSTEITKQEEEEAKTLRCTTRTRSASLQSPIFVVFCLVGLFSFNSTGVSALCSGGTASRIINSANRSMEAGNASGIIGYCT